MVHLIFLRTHTGVCFAQCTRWMNQECLGCPFIKSCNDEAFAVKCSLLTLTNGHAQELAAFPDVKEGD